MPRVPLPGIPEDVPARAEYVQETDPDAALAADGRSMLGPPERRRSRRRRGAWALAIGLVVLGVAAVIGSFFWVRSQYYVGEDAGQVVSSSKAAELKDEMDEILDEIDSVLEENAEEFVKSYVQKGGQ